ncbi:radical SAM protein [uncultured Phocaeicola sp.]|uniref:radical SAM/SPASM domain-containing protein n=1 Tax=uncultured Phocaeicola sp. TaxID=990718 RepID=UPI0014341AD2|nr:radical SAM protein [uncultured Phocaeicola sp.]GFH98030.1 coenzyme PQQ synthesis protein E [Bacteroidaceae bacterium]
MKFSQFNSMISLSENLELIYNSYSDSYLIISKKYLPLSDIESIKNKYPEVYNKLVESKCIIDHDINEVDLVKELQNSVDNNNKDFILTINPTLDCNFKCWYCYESHVKKSKIDPETLLKIKHLIYNVIATQKGIQHLQLNFFGGEPLLQYQIVLEIIKYAENICETNKKDISVAFTTNGYLLNQERLDTLSKYHVNTMQITLDGDRRTHDKIRFSSQKLGSYDRIIENIKNILRKKKIYITLRLNYTSENIDCMGNIVEDLLDLEDEEKKYLIVHFYRVWQDSEGEDISDLVKNTISKFREYGFKSYKYPLNNVRVSCYGDKTYAALVNYNGDVYRCTAVDFQKQRRDGYIDDEGVIVWENNSFEERKNAKFKNKPCLSCRLLPICNGGCTQHALRHKDEDYCIFNFDERKKDEAILNKLDIHLKYENF